MFYTENDMSFVWTIRVFFGMAEKRLAFQLPAQVRNWKMLFFHIVLIKIS